MQILNKKDVDDLVTWFNDYIRRFDLGHNDWQRNIELKKEHSLRVSNECRHIGEELDLAESRLYLAEILGLFHDIGRFEQYAQYKTFMDRDSTNHAELGESVLRETGVLNRLDETTQEIIYRAVRFHNLAEIPGNVNGDLLFYTKLLRDADKLDIYKVVTDYYHRGDKEKNDAIELNLPDSPGISSAVYDDLMKGQFVKTDHIQNLNDFKMLQIGWVYDINFEPTMRFIVERGYLDLIKAVLPDTNEIDEVFARIDSFINEKAA